MPWLIIHGAPRKNTDYCCMQRLWKWAFESDCPKITDPEWPNSGNITTIYTDYESNLCIKKAQASLKYHLGIIMAHLRISYSESIGYFGDIEFRLV